MFNGLRIVYFLFRQLQCFKYAVYTKLHFMQYTLSYISFIVTVFLTFRYIHVWVHVLKSDVMIV